MMPMALRMFIVETARNAMGALVNTTIVTCFHGSSAYEWLALPDLYYCRARMYTPFHGRFMQPDPNGFAGGGY